jgi:hypothetical protein
MQYRFPARSKGPKPLQQSGLHHLQHDLDDAGLLNSEAFCEPRAIQEEGLGSDRGLLGPEHPRPGVAR